MVSGLFSVLENNLSLPHWKTSLLPRAQWSKQTKKNPENCPAAAQPGFVGNGSIFLQLSSGSETSFVLATLVVCVFLVVSSRVTKST